MKKLIAVFVFVLLSGCSSYPSALSSHIDDFRDGVWDQCLTAVFLSDPKLTEQKVLDYCAKRLKQAIDENFQAFSAPSFPAKMSDFKDRHEYNYFLGIWTECYADAITQAKIKLSIQQALDFCSNVLNDQIFKDPRKNITFPPAPIFDPQT